MEDEIYEMAGKVAASENRKRVLESLANGIKIPSDIAKELNITTNYVSNALKDLRDFKLVECLNNNAKKGRLYKATDLGLETLKLLNQENFLEKQ